MNQRGSNGFAASTAMTDVAGWTEDGKRDWRGLMAAVSAGVQDAPEQQAPAKPARQTSRAKPTPRLASRGSEPSPAKRTLRGTGLAFACVLGFLTVSCLLWYWLSAPPAFSPDVTDRAATATEAFLFEDVETLKLLAVPGTEADLEAWLELARPTGWRLRVNNRQRPTANIKTEDARQGTALVYGRFYFKPGILQTAKADDYLPMQWRKMPDGEWKLDGSRTRKLTPAATRKLPPK